MLVEFPWSVHDMYRTLYPRCAFFLHPFFLFFSSFDFVSSQLRKMAFLLSSSERISSNSLFDLHHTTQASCLPPPANFSFLVLTGSPILLPLVLFLPPRRVDLLVPPTERKEGQTSLLLLQFLWHYGSASVLVVLPTLVICIQLPPTLLFVESPSE